MGQLEVFIDYTPSMWLSQGVLFNQVAATSKRVAKAFAKASAAVATAGAVILTGNAGLSREVATGWPPTLQEQQAGSMLAAVADMNERIAQRLAAFSTPDPGLDAEMLEEARMTLEAIAKRKA